ncbi:prephenate dehydrogenase, partial [Aegicerativicinus sediminis]
KNVCIIGTGLIGGSFALGIKKLYPNCKIIGIDSNPDHAQMAVAINLVDEAGSYEAIKDADLVVVAIPVDATVNELPKVLDAVSDDGLVIDVGSTKYDICKIVEDHPKRRNFLAAHPIAGTEFSGPRAAIPTLFEGKTNIICEVEKTAFKLQERALKLFNEMGMRIRYMHPAPHDKHIAFVSHLSHISSFMLGKTVIDEEKNEKDIFDMAGSGFASTVRLAKSSPEMWTPIFKQNRENIIGTLDAYIKNLQHFMDLMESDKYEDVYLEMKNTNRIKDILNGIT